jgi:hypothetical protein
VLPGIGANAQATGGVVLEVGEVASNVGDKFTGVTFDAGKAAAVSVDVEFSSSGVAVKLAGGSGGGAVAATKVCTVVAQSSCN